MITPESELRQYTELCPPAFPKTLITDNDPEGYEEALERYRQAVESATIIQGHGVTIFQGGPLDHRKRGGKDAWLTPTLIQDGTGISPFHLIHMNGSTWDNPGEIIFTPVADADLVLQNLASPEVASFNAFLDPSDTTPRTAVRYSSNGNTYYPYIHGAHEKPNAAVIASRLDKLGKVMGHQIPYSEEDLLAVEGQKREIIGRVDGFDVLEPHIAETEHGRFYLYGLVNPDDAWQYYEILTPIPLDQFNPDSEIFVRLDSGCDTGQCYHDEGCECRAQLHDAMTQAMERQGMLLLVPEHDGRGFGLVTKLLTEGAKQNKPMGYNNNIGRKLNTTEAAIALLGRRYDIRTFEGTAHILQALGIKRVQLFTDNVSKTQFLQEAGIEVVRVPTNTKNKITDSELLEHVEAKHASGLYFND